EKRPLWGCTYSLCQRRGRENKSSQEMLDSKVNRMQPQMSTLRLCVMNYLNKARYPSHYTIPGCDVNGYNDKLTLKMFMQNSYREGTAHID
ncbi:hypothetical protein L9F63_008619, partial [Diploptera punctata]